MSESENKQDEIKKESSKVKRDVSVKSSGGVVSKLSLVISLAAIGASAYIAVDNLNSKNIFNNDAQQYQDLQKQFDKLNLQQSEQKDILNDVGEQNDSQTQSIKSIQSQIISMNSQIATPAKDLYLQMSVANIQSAIDYLVLAKDVALFTGNIQKSEDLVDTAFDKIEASKVANISASDRQNINKALDESISKNDIINQFIVIEQQFSKLTYITPENLGKAESTSNSDKNKYMKFLSSIVEIQDIPKQQTLVSSNQAKQFASDNLYKALISLQTAMYKNNQDAINQSKTTLIKIIEKYFVQDAKAKTLINSINTIKAQNLDKFSDTLDKVINELSKQQNELLTKQVVLNTNISKKGNEK